MPYTVVWVVRPTSATLDPGILQLHSSAYRNPVQLRDGPVLVVGASHSGADLALEVAADHRTYLSGRIPGEVPYQPGERSAHVANHVVPFVFLHVLTLRNPLGRKAAPAIRHHGGPLIRVKRRHLEAAGVQHFQERTVGTVDGMPQLGDGRVLDVANVLWCTGYIDDFSWVEPAPLDAGGFPVQRRGIVEDVPGLYFLGLPFEFAFASMLTLGADRDAEYVARHIAHSPRSDSARSRTRRPRAGQRARRPANRGVRAA
jgi:putative flavoprotein involved in K+ transport